MAWYNITELQHKYNNNTRIIFMGLYTIKINLLHSFWNYLGEGNITKLIYSVCQTIELRMTLISFGCHIEKSLFRCLIKNIIRKLQFSLPLQKSNSGTLSFQSIYFFEVFYYNYMFLRLHLYWSLCFLYFFIWKAISRVSFIALLSLNK